MALRESVMAKLLHERWWPRWWGRGHRFLNSLVLAFGDIVLVGPALWWLWGQWQRLIPRWTEADIADVMRRGQELYEKFSGAQPCPTTTLSGSSVSAPGRDARI
jgi:hypothetical protein